RKDRRIWGSCWVWCNGSMARESKSRSPRRCATSTARRGTRWRRGSKLSAHPLVGVIMGSKSDWETMRQAGEVLTKFGVDHECRVLSAHRTPKETAEYVSGSEGRGMEAIIAGAGGAAHLAGVG